MADAVTLGAVPANNAATPARAATAGDAEHKTSGGSAHHNRRPRRLRTAGSVGSRMRREDAESIISSSILHIVGVPLIVVCVLAIGFILVYLKEILVPFVISIFFVYLLRPVVNTLSKPCGSCGFCFCCSEYEPGKPVHDSRPGSDIELAAQHEHVRRRRGSTMTSDDGVSVTRRSRASSMESLGSYGAGDLSEDLQGLAPEPEDGGSRGAMLVTTPQLEAGGAEKARLLHSGQLQARRSTPTTASGHNSHALLHGAGSSSSAGPHSAAGGRRHRPWCWRCRSSACPRWMAVLVALSVAFGVPTGLVLLVADAVQTFESSDLEEYEENAVKVGENILQWMHSIFHIDAKLVLESIKTNMPVAGIVQDVLVIIVDAVGNTLLILLFVLYLLFEQTAHPPHSLRGKIDDQIERYIGIKTLISAGVGLAVYVILGPMLGVKMAHLFGVLTFLMNYIPNVGPILATVIPLPVVILDPHMSTTSMLLAFILPSAIHMVIGNVVEPKWFGHSLELHPVVVLLALAFWFAIWGVPGAILSIPITAVMRIVLSHINHPYAIIVIRLLSGHIGLPSSRASRHTTSIV